MVTQVQPTAAPACDRTCCQQISGAGDGLVLKGENIEGGDIIYNDFPEFFSQHGGNRRFCTNCANCSAYIGGVTQQLQTIFAFPDNQKHLPGNLADIIKCWPADMHNGTAVQCNHKCGEYYCSEQCRDQHWAKSHNLLCVGHCETEEHPLVKFKEHARDNLELLLLGAIAFAVIVNQSKDANQVQTFMNELMSRFCHAHYPDTAAGAGPLFSQDRKNYAEEVLTEGFELLKTAWAHHAQHEAKCPELYKKMEPLFANINFFSHLLGMYEINNHDIELPHPINRCLQQRIPMLYQQNTPEAHAEIQVIQNVLVGETFKFLKIIYYLLKYDYFCCAIKILNL